MMHLGKRFGIHRRVDFPLASVWKKKKKTEEQNKKRKRTEHMSSRDIASLQNQPEGNDRNIVI